MDVRSKIIKLNSENNLCRDDIIAILQDNDKNNRELLLNYARTTCDKYYGKKIFVRGLIEFTNYCKNDCYYCGIRRSNKNCQRYRMDKETILKCCDEGYSLGFRTFVLQGGEDPFFTDDMICDIVYSIKEKYHDCAVTLSLGEKTREAYKKLFENGADRYLLRHETADKKHYEKLHPKEMSYENRMRCLEDLKEIGYQVGCGFMVGSPFQTTENLAEDLIFLKKFQPHMVGIGPFISHADTPFRDKENGNMEQTVKLLAMIRLLLPKVLLPATTALGTINSFGREMGIKAGANVVMPNLSPISVRKKYMLYDNKICTGEESAQCKICLANKMKSIGYEIVVDRGDCVAYNK
ncbi:MAG: [FeFe] hydrogenase H-cluster radical SAM maturase HydE [Acutalibacteraceae bacterium]